MEINYNNCTYVAGFMHDSSRGTNPGGHVEVGGDSDMPQYLKWVSIVKAEKGSIGYRILECEYPGEFYQIGRAFTKSGAERKVGCRLDEIVKDISEKHSLPIVDFDGAFRERQRADAIACERIVNQMKS